MFKQWTYTANTYSQAAVTSEGENVTKFIVFVVGYRNIHLHFLFCCYFWTVLQKVDHCATMSDIKIMFWNETEKQEKHAFSAAWHNLIKDHRSDNTTILIPEAQNRKILKWNHTIIENCRTLYPCVPYSILCTLGRKIILSTQYPQSAAGSDRRRKSRIMLT